MKENEVKIKQVIKLEEKRDYNIGIITDIHGNDVSLKEALKYLSNTDFIINLGDLPGIGPNSNEVLDIARDLIIHKKMYSVLGNHERYLLFGFKNPLSCLTFDQQEFTEKSISEENLKLIEKFPLELEINWQDKSFIFMHYARRMYDGVRFKLIDHEPTYEKLIDLFEFHKHDYVFYGHEHKGSIYEGNRHFINPGSTGCPCPNKNEMRFGILHLGKNINYEQINLNYDASRVVKDMINKRMPNRELIIKDFYKEDIEKYQK